MRFPDIMTLGDKYGPAMEIEDQKEADEYFEACVEHNMRMSGNSKKKAVSIEKKILLIGLVIAVMKQDLE